ncbi:MAG: phosphatase PAP2 family protein [Firmicutes bacterium]|nr:phosphatase PAP2 family protein [Bacillota bacterium]
MIKRMQALAAIAILLTLFAVLSFYVAAHPINNFDTTVTLFMQSQSWDSFLRTTNSIFASSAFRIVYVVLFVIFMVTRRYRRIVYLAAAGISEVISYAIKNVLSRPRPAAGLIKIYDPSTGFSFVSGHTLEYAIIFGFLGMMAIESAKERPIGYLWAAFSFIMPLIVGFGRVYSGAHWLTDTLGSYLLAAVILILLACLLGDAFIKKDSAIELLDDAPQAPG